MSYIYYGDEKRFTYLYLDNEDTYLYLDKDDDEKDEGDDNV